MGDRFPSLDALVLLHPAWLLALLVVPLILWVRGRRGPAVVVPYAATWHQPAHVRLTGVPVIVAVLGVSLVALALARPQHVETRQEVEAQGYDLMLAIDLSTSMLAEDYERQGRPINRLQAIKPILQAFIQQRPADRIGIVVFSGRSYTLAPLTSDHAWLARQTEKLKTGLIEDGTAIGDGLGLALSRLRQAKRAVGGRRVGAFVVLLTDGMNNRGSLAPEHAAELARARGIPVYLIGAGREGVVPYPLFDGSGRRIGTRPMLSGVDEPALRAMAARTGGAFFRAIDTGTTEAAFRAIDRAQTITFETTATDVRTELYAWPALAGAGLLLVALALSHVGRRVEVPA